jgi:hypothetical protein
MTDTPKTFDLDSPWPITLVVQTRNPLVRRTKLTDQEREIAQAIAPPAPKS